MAERMSAIRKTIVDYYKRRIDGGDEHLQEYLDTLRKIWADQDANPPPTKAQLLNGDRYFPDKKRLKVIHYSKGRLVGEINPPENTKAQWSNDSIIDKMKYGQNGEPPEIDWPDNILDLPQFYYLRSEQ